jgi:ATP/maltotriose-dependent transcriptional regulator MalT
MIRFFTKYRLLLLYGFALALLLFLLKWLEYRFVIIDHAFEVYITLVALLFTALGIWLALKLVQPKTQTIVVEKEVYINHIDEPFTINEVQKQKLGLSNREIEVLQLMAAGFSNQEIADQLFVSVNTIKTHSSNVFEKLDVKRRTQAVEKAKQLRLIA